MHKWFHREPDPSRASMARDAQLSMRGARAQKVFDLKSDLYTVCYGEKPADQLLSEISISAWIVADRVVQARQAGQRDRLYICLYVYDRSRKSSPPIFDKQCELVAEYRSTTDLHVNDFKVLPAIPKGGCTPKTQKFPSSLPGA